MNRKSSLDPIILWRRPHPLQNPSPPQAPHHIFNFVFRDQIPPHLQQSLHFRGTLDAALHSFGIFFTPKALRRIPVGRVCQKLQNLSFGRFARHKPNNHPRANSAQVFRQPQQYDPCLDQSFFPVPLIPKSLCLGKRFALAVARPLPSTTSCPRRSSTPCLRPAISLVPCVRRCRKSKRTGSARPASLV